MPKMQPCGLKNFRSVIIFSDKMTTQLFSNCLCRQNAPMILGANAPMKLGENAGLGMGLWLGSGVIIWQLIWHYTAPMILGSRY